MHFHYFFKKYKNFEFIIFSWFSNNLNYIDTLIETGWKLNWGFHKNDLQLSQYSFGQTKLILKSKDWKDKKWRLNKYTEKARNYKVSKQQYEN